MGPYEVYARMAKNERGIVCGHCGQHLIRHGYGHPPRKDGIDIASCQLDEFNELSKKVTAMAMERGLVDGEIYDEWTEGEPEKNTFYFVPAAEDGSHLRYRILVIPIGWKRREDGVFVLDRYAVKRIANGLEVKSRSYARCAKWQGALGMILLPNGVRFICPCTWTNIVDAGQLKLNVYPNPDGRGECIKAAWDIGVTKGAKIARVWKGAASDGGDGRIIEWNRKNF